MPVPPRNVLDARHADIARRYKRRRRDGPPRKPTVAALRVPELTRIYRARHGHTLPDTAIGRDCAGIMCHHLASLSGDPRKRINGWLRLWCPWMPIAEAEGLLAEAVVHTRRWRADALAWRLQLIEADRAALGITTIGSIDVGREQRIIRRKLRRRALAEANRRAKGAKPRADYLASATKPWLALGISRRTWYRRRIGVAPGTSP